MTRQLPFWETGPECDTYPACPGRDPRPGVGWHRLSTSPRAVAAESEPTR